MSKIKITDLAIIFKDSALMGKVFLAAILFFVAVIVMNGTGFNPLSYPLGAIAILPFLFKDELFIYPAEDRVERRFGFQGKRLQELSLDEVDCITIKTVKTTNQVLLNVDYIAEIQFKDDKWPSFEYGRLPDRQHILPVTKLIGALIGKTVHVSPHCIGFYEDIVLPPGMIAELAKPKPGEKLPLDQIAADKWLKRYLKK